MIRDIFKKAENKINDESSLGCPDMVPFWLEIKRLIDKGFIDIYELECIFRDDFENYKEAPWELVQLCMYHLKLPDFRDYLHSKYDIAVATNDWRAVPVIEHILDAYELTWQDKALFYSCS